MQQPQDTVADRVTYCVSVKGKKFFVFLANVVSAHKDCVDPELVLAQPTRWFKVSEVRLLNNRPIDNLDDFIGKSVLTLFLASFSLCISPIFFKDKFKIGDMVNVHTTIHGIDYILDVKVIRDVLETVPDALENVKVVQPPKIRNPRTKKVDYNEAESDDFNPDAFEDDFDPADYSDEISDEDDDPFLKQDDQVDLNNNLNDSCNRLSPYRR